MSLSKSSFLLFLGLSTRLQRLKLGSLLFSLPFFVFLSVGECDAPLPQLPLENYSWLVHQFTPTQLKSKQNGRRIQDLPLPPLAQRRSLKDQNSSSGSSSKISLGTWIRNLPLRPPNTPVYLYNQELKSIQNVHEAVLELDTGSRDLQQCADAAIRIYAEYQYSQKQDRQISFNYTSGDRIPFRKWANGKRPKVVKEIRKGKTRYRVKWLNSKKKGRSYSNFKAYLKNIFRYAGTASLSRQLKKRPIQQIQIGDLYLQGGFPGHAVMVMDLADHPQWGPLMLLAQSYMPAQDMHILKNHENPTLSPWFQIPKSGQLHTPEWSFSADLLYTFE